MPKLPRIGSRECLSALQKMGFSITRQRGSHIVLRRGASGCVVPNHKEIRVGTLSGILKQAGVSVEEFIQNL
ncbi:type II toxin-antitoxin system HicA family toxin [Kamptonema cortianum]|nr:type II toxin-antitoxin system HicA family toxin [Oscillatoria laete-virens]MDK3155358.1 type II toxin-antitoxin system HicA family toxin [Kamptonema cortianum]MDL5046107.1 type II toxin-antitoxin system HicA family toxin [Oscillatoria amoena NRMC-F 0135]MDL5052808.1 type II toxin-antitoxin system HicA family toxin [Oscillatoria laete-virens NRMC-F 0139]